MQPLRYAPAPPSLYVDRIGWGAGQTGSRRVRGGYAACPRPALLLSVQGAGAKGREIEM